MTTQIAIDGYKTLAKQVMEERYSHVMQGRLETWEQICRRVCYWIMGKGSKWSIPKDVHDACLEMMIARKIVPGGRILAQTGREYHQVSNCFLLRAEDTREGWADLASKAMSMMMTGS